MVHIVGQVKSTVYDAIMRYIDYENMRISDSELCLSGAFFILYFILPGLGYSTVLYSIIFPILISFPNAIILIFFYIINT